MMIKFNSFGEKKNRERERDRENRWRWPTTGGEERKGGELMISLLNYLRCAVIMWLLIRRKKMHHWQGRGTLHSFR